MLDSAAECPRPVPTGTVHRVRPGPRRRARPGRPAYGLNTANIVVGLLATDTAKIAEGMTRVTLLGDPTRGLGNLAEPECRRIIAALDLAERLRRTGGVVRAVLRRADRHGQRHREHGLDRRRPAPADRVHPGRRRGERHRHRRERRRAAVLERRGDDAHAHPGHPGDDAGQRHGADRQAGAGLLRRGVGRGQLRHRRLRPRSWAPTARRSTGRPTSPDACEILLRHYDHTYVVPGETYPRRRPTSRPGRPGRAYLAACRRGRQRPSPGRRHLLRRAQPRPQEALRHALGDARRHRCRRRAAGTLGALARSGDRRSCGTRTSAASRSACSGSSRTPCRGVGSCRPAVRRRGRPARCSRSRRASSPGPSTPPAGTGRWWYWPTCPASTAHRSRCAAGSSSTARRSAGRSPTSAARSSSWWSPATTVGRSSCSPRRSTNAWRSRPSRARSPR